MNVWYQIWSARFGERLTPDQAGIWEAELEHEITNLAHSEIVDGVRAIGQQRRTGKLKYKPDLNTLITAIINNRYERRYSSTGPQTTSEERMNMLKGKLRHAMEDGDVIAAWNTLCHHGVDNRLRNEDAVDEMKKVEKWAAVELGFARPTLAEMGLQPLVLAFATNVNEDGW